MAYSGQNEHPATLGRDCSSQALAVHGEGMAARQTHSLLLLLRLLRGAGDCPMDTVLFAFEDVVRALCAHGPGRERGQADERVTGRRMVGCSGSRTPGAFSGERHGDGHV